LVLPGYPKKMTDFRCAVSRTGVQLGTHSLASALGVLIGAFSMLFLMQSGLVALPAVQQDEARCPAQAPAQCPQLPPVTCDCQCPTCPPCHDQVQGGTVADLVASGTGQVYSAPWQSRAPFDVPEWFEQAQYPPYKVMHPMLTPEQCNDLIEAIPKLIPKREALFGTEMTELQKQQEVVNADHYVLHKDIDDYHWLFRHILATINNVNDKTWRKAVPRDFQSNLMEPLLFAGYNASFSGKYNWHTDVGATGWHTKRALSAVILLSEPEKDFKGGDFQVFFSLNKFTVPQVKQGTMIIFPSHMLHRLKPVAEGFRMSIVVQIMSPAV